MIVVADSSPLNYLIRLGYIGVAPQLFDALAIPPAVVREMSTTSTPAIVREFLARPPNWLTVVIPHSVLVLPGLGRGEVEAISLVRQVDASAILMDDLDGRRAARSLRIPVFGTIGVLEAAANKRLVDLNVAFQRLRETDFRIPGEFLDERLRLFRSRSTPDS